MSKKRMFKCACGTTNRVNFGKSKATSIVCKGCGTKFVLIKTESGVRIKYEDE